MGNGYVLFYDSGIGGLTTLNETIKLLPKERFLYFADDQNCPYGNKSKEEIEALVLENVKRLLKDYEIKMIVFACNTVTTCSVGHFRAKYDIDIIGTEPAILPAIRESKTKEILVTATLATFKQERYKNLLNKAGGRVYSLGFTDLAKEIEQSELENRPIDTVKYVKEIELILKRFKNIDGLVLGCTHYCYYKTVFEKMLNIKTYDGNNGVARRVNQLLEDRGNKSTIDFKGSVKFVLSSNNDSRKRAYIGIFNRLKMSNWLKK